MSAEQFAFGEPAPASRATRTVRIEVKALRFAPSTLSFHRGEIVHFILTNTSAVDHEFVIGDMATQAAHRAEMAHMEGAHSMTMDSDNNAISIGAHSTGELTWRFSGSGLIQYACNIPGHYEAGMHGTITLD